MRIIARRTLIEFYTQNTQSTEALEEWFHKTTKAEWKSFADVKKTFNTVSSVGNHRYVFNIKGNDYRLITIIKFRPSFVYIRFTGTHSDYDRIKDIENI